MCQKWCQVDESRSFLTLLSTHPCNNRNLVISYTKCQQTPTQSIFRWNEIINKWIGWSKGVYGSEMVPRWRI